MLTLSVVLALRGVASAVVYYPSRTSAGDNDLDDSDHHYYYARVIGGLVTIGPTQAVTNASTTFKNLYNWDADLSKTNSNLLASPAQPDLIDLTSRSFVFQNIDPTNTGTLNTALMNAGFNSAERSALIDPGPAWVVGTVQGTNGGYDYTYDFTAPQLTTLKTYINNGNDIALAFDPDCHFWNEGSSFSYDVSQSAAAAVPEPATLLLLGTGLIVASRYRRKIRKPY